MMSMGSPRIFYVWSIFGRLAVGGAAVGYPADATTGSLLGVELDYQLFAHGNIYLLA